MPTAVPNLWVANLRTWCLTIGPEFRCGLTPVDPTAGVYVHLVFSADIRAESWEPSGWFELPIGLVQEVDFVSPRTADLVMRVRVQVVGKNTEMSGKRYRHTATVNLIGLPSYRLPLHPLWHPDIDAMLHRQATEGDIRHVIADWLRDHGRDGAADRVAAGDDINATVQRFRREAVLRTARDVGEVVFPDLV